MLTEIAKPWCVCAGRQYLIGVVWPVCCEVEQSIGLESRHQKIEKFRLNESSFVVPFFGPRIGEVDMCCI